MPLDQHDPGEQARFRERVDIAKAAVRFFRSLECAGPARAADADRHNRPAMKFRMFSSSS